MWRARNSLRLHGTLSAFITTRLSYQRFVTRTVLQLFNVFVKGLNN
jgi:hypothetical protein